MKRFPFPDWRSRRHMEIWFGLLLDGISDWLPPVQDTPHDTQFLLIHYSAYYLMAFWTDFPLYRIPHMIPSFCLYIMAGTKPSNPFSFWIHMLALVLFDSCQIEQSMIRSLNIDGVWLLHNSSEDQCKVARYVCSVETISNSWPSSSANKSLQLQSGNVHYESAMQSIRRQSSFSYT